MIFVVALFMILQWPMGDFCSGLIYDFELSLGYSSATLEWAMSEMLLNPSMMRKVQKELESMVGLERRVEESDIPRLDYLKAVVKEMLRPRLHMPGPLIISHESFQDCTAEGYYIARKSRIIVNAWAVARDPKSWEDAEVFRPERFIGNPINIKG